MIDLLLLQSNREVAVKYGLAPELDVVTVIRLAEYPNLPQVKLAVVLAELAQMLVPALSARVQSRVLSNLLRPLVMCAVNTIVIRLAIPAQLK